MEVEVGELERGLLTLRQLWVKLLKLLSGRLLLSVGLWLLLSVGLWLPVGLLTMLERGTAMLGGTRLIFGHNTTISCHIIIFFTWYFLKYLV